MTDDHINIFYSEEDAGYIADIPDRHAPAEALSEVQLAKTA